MTDKSLNRRSFVKKTAAGAAATAATFSVAPPSVLGANERIRIGVIGPGGRVAGYNKERLAGHMGHLCRFGKDWNIDVTSVCDVWDFRTDRAAELSKKQGGYNPKKAYRDYRKVLDDKNVDAVLIGTPDHWHARQTIDAANAGKDIYCEKPMTHTIEEARQVVEAVRKNKRIMQVGVQSMADPRWMKANEMIRQGKIGHIMQAQTSYYRNSSVGQWRYYTLEKAMTPQSIDWKMFLGTDFGLAPEMPFDRAIFQQWRCYWPFGGGMYTDLFVHQMTHLITAMGVRYPRRVVGAGGLYMEYDGRDVPDVATVVADYDEGCQSIVTATMCNDYPIQEVVRGHTGTIHFTGEGFEVIPQSVKDASGQPSSSLPKGGEKIAGQKFKGDQLTQAHWQNFLECVRTRTEETNNTPELGEAAIVTVNLGVRSYREGKAFFFDKDTMSVSEADSSWSKSWEKRSMARGKPNQIKGWSAGENGSLLYPPEYQKYAGPWIDGKDPHSEAGD